MISVLKTLVEDMGRGIMWKSPKISHINHQGITWRSSEYLEGFTWGSRMPLQESGFYQVTSLVAVAVGFHLTSYNESIFSL